MLKDYGKLLLDEQRNGKRFCVVVACVEDSKLQIHREDYGEWEMSCRTGTAGCDYYLDESNTTKLCKFLDVRSSPQLISAIRKKCHSRNDIAYTENFRSLCDDNEIGYDYRVWY